MGKIFQIPAREVIDKYGYQIRHIYSSYDETSEFLVVDSIQGSKLVFPRKTNMQMLYGMLVFGCWRPRETEFIRRIIREGMVVIDVGAYVGYFTMLFSKLVGSKGRVIAFEPWKEWLHLCEISQKLNDYKNIEFYNLFVSNTCGRERFDEDDMMSSISGSREVETSTIDSIVSGRVDFIKIDAEGFEPEVIAGMKRVVKQNPNLVILMDDYSELWGRRGITPQMVKNILNNVDINAYIMNNFDDYTKKNFDELVFRCDPKSSMEDIRRSIAVNRTTLILCNNINNIIPLVNKNV